MALVKQVGMLRPRFKAGRSGPVRVVVIHATAGKHPGDYGWLRNGGGVVRGKDNPVSIHYYIDKQGNVAQMVEDGDTAWHAGASSWRIDGQVVGSTLNPVSIGIELENRNNGRDPYPPAQIAATLSLTRTLVTKYNIPRRQLVRHLDISPGRKDDPRGFAWEQFVADVYSGQPVPAPVPGQPAPPVPPAEPLPPDQQLRRLLIDLAYRAAGGAAPAGWPLLKAAVSRATGMPISVLSTPFEGEGEGEEDASRPLLVEGMPPLLVETFGRDLFYAVAEQPDTVLRLSESGPGPVRDALLKAMFSQVDPANGFQPNWAFHQRYLEQPTAIGVPLGPNHLLAGATSDGKRYACQHFAAESLASPTDDYGKLFTLSDLTRDMYTGDPHTPLEKELRTLLLNDLYMARTGRKFDPSALFCRFAIANGIGAPTAKAEVQTLGDKKFVAMPYALDVLYCRIPGDGNWERVSVGVLGTEDESGLGRLSQLMSVEALEADAAGGAATGVLGGVLSSGAQALPEKIYGGGVLGRAALQPHIEDLANLGPLAAPRGEDRNGLEVELVVVYPTYGSAAEEIAAAAKPGARPLWHYYVGSDGSITQLVDERGAGRVAGPALWDGRPQVDARSVAVAVEGAALSPLDGESEQGRALAWLLADIAQRHNLARTQVIQAADLAMRIGPAWGGLVQGI